MKTEITQKRYFRIVGIFLIGIAIGFSLYYVMYQDKSQKLVTRSFLDESLSLGRSFLLNNQKRAGNFNYEYDFIKKSYPKGDNQVRQAGALWGIALIHQDSPSEETAKAIEKGLAFFDKHSRQKANDQGKYIVYPKDRSGRTGTVALVTLALIDYLRSDSDIPMREKYEKNLQEYMKFLLSLRVKDGRFSQAYSYRTGNKTSKPSPYFDGETLLAMIKAAKYLEYDWLKDTILESAERMFNVYVIKALDKHPDSNTTKGFYQWGSMAFYEIYTTGWEGLDMYPQRVIDLAYWMIDVHETLKRRKNTAYAYEGMIVAWELANLIQHHEAKEKIGNVIDQGLYKLTSWQIGGPNMNIYLKWNKTDDKKAIGGILNIARWDPLLRIDVTQHQMHAVILARRFIYKNGN